MESISNKSIPEHPPVKRHRRRHSPAFKAEVLAACVEPGASIAAVAQRYQINANLVHKWRKDASQSDRLRGAAAEFVSLPLGAVGADYPGCDSDAEPG